MFNLGAFGKYFTLLRLAEAAVVSVSGDPSKAATAVAHVNDKVGQLQLNIEGFEHEVDSAVQLAFALLPHTQPPTPAAPAPAIAPGIAAVIPQ